MKRVYIFIFSIILLIPASMLFYPGHAKAIGTERFFQDPNNENIYYFVGMVWYETWSSSGSPTGWGNTPPNQRTDIDGFDYNFTFNSNRTIKDITVSEFRFNWQYADETFTASRTGELEVHGENYYKDAKSSSYSYDIKPWSGQGTNAAVIPVYVTNGLLTANLRAVDRRDEEERNGQTFGSGVQGWRYFFPTLFKIELDPVEGKAIIKHFTTTGQSLNGVNGFSDREEDLIKNRPYSYSHPLGNATYEYQGYKKSTVSAPSGGTPTAGDPSGFTYDGSFPVYYLFYYYKENNNGPPGTLCTIPAPGRSVSGQFMDPGVTAEIRADQRGSESFDVLQGIPSSESLYGHAASKDYLYQNTFVEMSGTCKYNIKIKKTYTLKWDPTKQVPNTTGSGTHPVSDPKEEKVSVPYSYTIERPYSYWTINNLEIYELSEATLSNDALPGGTITLEPGGYTAPNFSTEITGKYIAPVAPELITAADGVVEGETTKPIPDDDTEVLRPLAEVAAKKIEVQNDTLIFGGQTLMNGSVVTEVGPAPGTIPPPQLIGDNVLYKPGNVIVPTHPNARNLPSSGEIQYGLMDNSINAGSSEQTFPILGINSITVHTPVVNYSLLPDDNRPFDQRMVPDMTRTVLILDRPFTVHFTESGQHLNMPGYGNRDYAKYTKNKRIQFPFGVFQGSDYYPENTWIYIPVGTPSMTFTMPTWVNEGDYTIHTQSWAINAPSDDADLCEVNLNGDLTNYCASESFNVGVVGRLFDFRIWDIGDFRFEKVFRTGMGTLEHSSAMYYTGGNDENGNPTALSGLRQWQLPIRKSSHPTEQLTVPHNGYSFLFDFRTIGNLWQPGEGIRIEPSFYFIQKTGGSPIPVDLYYDISGSNNKMIGVGSSKDKLSYTRTYRLADGFRNISGGELSTAASYEYNYIMSEAERAKTPWLKFYEQYIKRKTKIAKGYDLEVLPYKSRTLVGPTVIPNIVNPITAVRSVQHWYGEYNLPIAPYILPKGTNIVTLANQYGGALDGHEQEFITGGYILVKFEIYTVKNGDVATRILGYKAPIANMWAIEGQMTGDTDERGQTFSFSSGDIILFESDYSVRNDYQGQGK